MHSRYLPENLLIEKLLLVLPPRWRWGSRQQEPLKNEAPVKIDITAKGHAVGGGGGTVVMITAFSWAAYGADGSVEHSEGDGENRRWVYLADGQWPVAMPTVLEQDLGGGRRRTPSREQFNRPMQIHIRTRRERGRVVLAVAGLEQLQQPPTRDAGGLVDLLVDVELDHGFAGCVMNVQSPCHRCSFHAG